MTRRFPLIPNALPVLLALLNLCIVLALLLGAAPVRAAGAADKAADRATARVEDGVVYHVDDAAAQGLTGLRNIRNHLDSDPAARIVVVTHADGVDLLMEGAKAPSGTEFAPLVAALRARGVRFEVCEITLRDRKLSKDLFIQEADFTPSGVVRLAQLQQQGYAYIKP